MHIEELYKTKIFKSLKFTHQIDISEYKMAEQVSGIYILLNELSEVIYVGKSINIRKRVYHHFKGFKKTAMSDYIRNECHGFLYSEILLPTEMDLFETLMIDYFKPKCNIDKLELDRKIHNTEITKAILVRNEEIILDKASIDFIIKFFKNNKEILIGMNALKMLMTNNGYDSTHLFSIANLKFLEGMGIEYKTGRFRCDKEKLYKYLNSKELLNTPV